MLKKLPFYILVIALLGGIGFIASRFFFGVNEPLIVKAAKSLTERIAPSESETKASDATKKGTPGIWADQRLLNMQWDRSQVRDLKTQAEIENNMRNLFQIYQDGDLNSFKESIEKLGKDFPEIPEYQAMLGDFYQKHLFWDKAEVAIENLLKLDPQNNFAAASLVKVKLVRGDKEGALQIAEALVQKDPSDYNALQAIKESLKANGQAEKAEQRIEEIYRANPKNDSAAVSYAEQIKDPKERMIILEKAHHDNPSSILAAEVLSREYFERGEYIKSEKYFSEMAARTSDPNYKRGALMGQIQSLLELIAQNPGDIEAQAVLHSLSFP